MAGFFFNALVGAAGARKPYKRRVAYLESTGTQWIDTGIVPSVETTLLFKYEHIGMGDNAGAMICGQTATHGTRANMFGVGPSQTNDRIYTFFGSYPVYKIPNRSGENLRLYRGGLWNADDDTQYLAPLSDAVVPSITTDRTLYLFAENYGGTLYRRGKTKLYYLKILNNGVLQRDFIPVIDWNNRPAMYDKVSGQMFYNQGTGEFNYA